MEIVWSVAPADRLVCGGMWALHREGIVVAIKLFTILIVIVPMSSKAIAVLNVEPVCIVTQRGALCRGWKERVTLLVDWNSCR